MGDDDYMTEKYLKLDSNDKDSLMNFIRNEMSNSFHLTDYGISVLRNTLIFYCYFKDNAGDWKAGFDSMLLPIDPPDDVMNFYRWYYEVFFGEVDLSLYKADDFSEQNAPAIFDLKNAIWHL